jgi:hypothetical protein
VTVVLVVLAVVLGVWVWLGRDRVTDDERQRRENNVFVAWRRDELTAISIAHDGELIVLERDLDAMRDGGEGKDGSWRMTMPRRERADPVAVDRLLGTLELATIARKVGDGGALGLDVPRATGFVRMGALEIKFALGGDSPRPAGSGYFQIDTDPPIVVTKEVVDALLAGADTYRDRTVVPYLGTELAGVSVKHPAGGFTLERIDDRSFRVEPAGVLASRAAVDRLWASLAEMRAEAFPKDADVDRLTAHPAATLVLSPKDKSKPPAELVIGDVCPGHPNDLVVSRRTPTRVAACAPKDILEGLLADASSLVEKHPFTLRMDEIEELRLERTPAADAGAVPDPSDGGGAAPSVVEIARKGTGFHAREPFDRDLSVGEADAAGELVTRIGYSEALAVKPGAGAPFAFVGRALVRADERQEVVELGPLGAGGHAIVRRVLDDARLEVDAAVYRRLIPRATSLRARTMLDHETRRPSRVVLRCGIDQELVDRGEGFRLVSPPGYETDGSIAQLVDAVVRGRIDAWVADEDDGTFGFTRDGCHLVIGFDDGNAPVTVWFGREAESGIYVRVDPRSGVLVAARSIRDLAKSLYVSRGSLRTDAALIDHVRVISNGKVVPPGDLARADRVREGIADLFADRVVSLKKPEGAPNLVLEVTVSEGGPPRRIDCRPVSSAERYCGIDGTNATFSVSAARLAPFPPNADAGAPLPSSSAPYLAPPAGSR